MFLVFPFVAALLLSFNSMAATHEQMKAAWVGEWGSFDSFRYPDIEASTGHILRISECYVRDSKLKIYNCALRMQTRKNKSVCTAWSQVALDSDEHIAFSMKDSDRNVACNIDLKRVPGDKPIVDVTYSGKCDGLCRGSEANKAPQPLFAKSYPLRSTTSFLPVKSGSLEEDVNVANCYASASPAVREWCTNENLGALEAEDVKRVQSVTHDCYGSSDFAKCYADFGKKQKANYFAFRMSLWEKCDKSENSAACLEQNYNAKLNAFKKDEQDKANHLFGSLGSVQEASKLANTIDGVYKVKGQHILVTGEKYEAEDVLELVQTSDPRSLYFKTRLNFANGHQCSLFGVAKYRDKGGFVYQADNDDGVCQMQIKVKNDGLSFNDVDGKCRQQSCGARGGYEGIKFPLSKRRTIRYMQLLKNSEDYKNSLEASKG